MPSYREELFRILRSAKNHFPSAKTRPLYFCCFSITFVACSPVLLLAYGIILGLKPLVIIRFGKIRSDRIGHFVLEAALAKSETQTQAPNEINFYYYDRPTCNSHWASIVENSLHISELSRLFCVLNALLPGGKKHNSSTGEKIRAWRVSQTNWEVQANFSIDANVSTEGINFMRKFGWQDNMPIVCLMVRDSKYLLHSSLHKDKVWDYHSYRDSEISTYKNAVAWLLDKGYWVVRMGHDFWEPFPINHPRFIDYPFQEDKNGMHEIWLYKNCCLSVSTGSGPEAFATIYKKPMLFLNILPTTGFNTAHNCIWVPKNLSYVKTNKKLTLKQYIEHSYPKSDDYEQNGIKITDLTDNDLYMATKEAVLRLENKWIDTSRSAMLNEQAIEVLKKSPKFIESGAWFNENARFGSDWLITHQSSLFETKEL